jgi:hypothetical protein
MEGITNQKAGGNVQAAILHTGPAGDEFSVTDIA